MSDGTTADAVAAAEVVSREHDEYRGAGLFYYYVAGVPREAPDGGVTATTMMMASRRDAVAEASVAELAFCSGNPKIEMTHGVIRLYHRPSASGSAGEKLEGGSSALGGLRGPVDGAVPVEPLPPQRGTSLLALGVPHTISMSDLLEKTKAFHEHMATLRIVRPVADGVVSGDGVAEVARAFHPSPVR